MAPKAKASPAEAALCFIRFERYASLCHIHSCHIGRNLPIFVTLRHQGPAAKRAKAASSAAAAAAPQAAAASADPPAASAAELQAAAPAETSPEPAVAEEAGEEVEKNQDHFPFFHNLLVFNIFTQVICACELVSSLHFAAGGG